MGRLDLDWRVFLGLGVAGMILSASHLGRKERAWRAVLNFDRSWLSREIVLVGGFLALAAGVLFFPGLPPWLGWVGVVLGLVTLAAIDQVYKVTVIRGSGPLHSAHVLGTGLMLAAVWNGSILVAGAMALVKLVLYLARKRDRAALGLSSQAVWGWLRVASLFMGTGALVMGKPWLAMGLYLVGEMIDRGEFYQEMEIPTPSSMMQDELEARLGEKKDRPGPEIPKRKGDRDRHLPNRVENLKNTKIVRFYTRMASKRFRIFKYFLPGPGIISQEPDFSMFRRPIDDPPTPSPLRGNPASGPG